MAIRNRAGDGSSSPKTPRKGAAKNKPAARAKAAARKPKKSAAQAAQSKKSQPTIDRVIRALRLGCSFEQAAACGAISYETLNNWRKADPEFAAACENARAEMAQAMLARIEAAAALPQHWTAAAWKLERIFPAQFALTRRMPTETQSTDPAADPNGTDDAGYFFEHQVVHEKPATPIATP